MGFGTDTEVLQQSIKATTYLSSYTWSTCHLSAWSLNVLDKLCRNCSVYERHLDSSDLRAWNSIQTVRKIDVDQITITIIIKCIFNTINSRIFFLKKLFHSSKRIYWCLKSKVNFLHLRLWGRWLMAGDCDGSWSLAWGPSLSAMWLWP